LALSILCQSQVFHNFQSGSFVVLFGEVHFFNKRFSWLSLLVILHFGKFCFLPLLKNKLCVKVGRVGGGFFFQQSLW
jgi:hypothetical protein